MRIGSLFSGYGGLDMAVEEVFGATTAWVSDIDRGACKILAHRYPTTPNLGDITSVDWGAVEPVDIVIGGSPCQDLSHAGKRQGMTSRDGGTRSNLWVAMREAIAQLRPRYVVWENVRGAYSAEADSELESDARLLAGVRRRDGEPVLRALGRVLGDLSELGYDCRWHGLRAADVGAPHGRFRVFVVATDAKHDGRPAEPFRRGAGAGEGIGRLLQPQGPPADPTDADTRRLQRGTGWSAVAGEAQGGRAFGDVAGRDLLPTPQATRGGSHTETVGLLPTPRATDGTKGGPNQRGSSGDLMLPSAVASLPTPAVNDMGAAYTPETWDAWTDDMKTRHGNGHGKSLAIKAQRLLPTPRASDGPDPSSHGRTWSGTDNNLHNVARKQQWGDYAAAIARWEHTLGRPAPAPTMTSTKGNPQLSPVFVEWLMGLPAGWVTEVPGITRNEALKALGNGVVPQQATAALRHMLAWEMAT
jgi:DNA (cytosine-5)-methyltransferase 1